MWTPCVITDCIHFHSWVKGLLYKFTLAPNLSDARSFSLRAHGQLFFLRYCLSPRFIRPFCPRPTKQPHCRRHRKGPHRRCHRAREVGLDISIVTVGGAVNTLLLHTRLTTSDVDFFFRTKTKNDRVAGVLVAAEVARKALDLDEHWMNNHTAVF